MEEIIELAFVTVKNFNLTDPGGVSSIHPVEVMPFPKIIVLLECPVKATVL